MDLTVLFEKLLSAGGVSTVMLVGVLWWIFVRLLPARDDLYRQTLLDLQTTFKDALGLITDNQKQVNERLHERINNIDSDLKEINKTLKK